MASFTLAPLGPFSLDRAADVVKNFPPLRHQPGLGADGKLRIGFLLDDVFLPVAVALSQSAEGIAVEVSGVTRDEDLARVERQVARIFSLDHDATAYPELAERDPRFGALMKTLAGLRPVCFTSPYECAAWAIISQRIATTQAARIVELIVELRGSSRIILGERVPIFPTPKHLLTLDSIPGLAAAKVERLHGIARAALEGKLDAEALRALGEERAVAALQELPGIGPFWSKGIYLRACGIVDVFPDEPIGMAALAALHGREPNPASLIELTEPLRPFRMWACFLLRVAFARGALSTSGTLLLPLKKAKPRVSPSGRSRKSSARPRLQR